MKNRLSPQWTIAAGQSGAATLLFTLVLLMAMLVIGLYSTRNSISELLLTNNALRYKQATTAADGALDFALAHYIQYGGDQNNDNIADILTIPTSLLATGTASAQYCTPTSTFTACTAPTDLGNMRIIATGRSLDGTAVHYSTTLVAAKPVFGVNPKAPFIAKGASSATLNGNLTVVNNLSKLTIWTGTDVGDATGSFTTKINIDGVNNQVSSEKSGSKFYVGPDVVYNDHNLKNATSDEFFLGVTGSARSTVINGADMKLTGTATLGTDPDGLNWGGKIIYVDKSTYDPNANLGTADKPVILVVNGNFELNGPNTVYGVVIANNLTKANGSAKIYGSLIVNDVSGANGGFTIEANQSVLNGLSKITFKGQVRSAWRDWE